MAAPDEFIVLAASPYFGGPMTEPHRLVVLRWWNGEHTVHYQAADGAVSSGRYFWKDLGAAVRRWHALVSDKLDADEPFAAGPPDAGVSAEGAR